MKFLTFALAAAACAMTATSACAQTPSMNNSPQVGFPPTVAPGAQLQVAYEEKNRFFEGPAWDAKTNRLYFTAHASGDKPFQILRLTPAQNNKVEIWKAKTEGINGMFLSKTKGLLGAQGTSKLPAIVAMALGETAPENPQVLAQASEANPMSQTNDLCPDERGGIYFTCPDFDRKTDSRVYYIQPDGQLKMLISNLKLPNGIQISRDGRTLYVADSFEKRIYAYPIGENGGIDGGKVRIFFDPATPNQNDPDGMTIDNDGNLYCAMRGGIWCASPEGKTLGFVPIPEFVSNVTFGGPDLKTLYMTTGGKLYSLQMTAQGVG